MNTKERIAFFNRDNAPFSIVAHDNKRFSLGLELTADYGQSAFNRFAELIGDPVKENDLYTHGSGYEWETVFRKAFEDDPRLSQITFDCEASGFFCYANDLSLLMNFGQRFRILCEDQNRFSELVCTALRDAARSAIASDRSPREIMRLDLSYDSKLNHKTYHAELSLPATDAEIEDAMHQLRCMDIGAPEITVHTGVIPELIRSNVTGSLSEYNAFAIRMNLLSEEEFTAMCTVINNMLSVTISGITMADLINMTYSPDAISVISNVRNDTELGQNVIEHDLNEDVSAVPEASRYLLDTEKIGKLQREIDRGWFDGSNYYVLHEIRRSDVYDGETRPDELLPKKIPFALHDDGSISSPIIPLNQVQCRNFEGATELREIEQRWNQMSPVQRMTLKAILAAEKPASLKDALFLTDHLYRFQVSVSVDHDEDFAMLFLQYHLPFLTDDEFFDRLSLYEFGTEVMKRMNVTVTDHGAVSEYGGTLYEKIGKQMDRNEVYELIEVCGHKALFTNEKLYNRNVPKGLCCYDIRTDDGGNFCTLEANVYVNHGGSVLFREPIELGKEEYIVFDEETSPNFLGDTMSADEFANAVFDEEEATDMNNSESSVNTPSEEYTEENGMGGMELC